jgi:hypothetical protein
MTLIAISNFDFNKSIFVKTRFVKPSDEKKKKEKKTRQMEAAKKSFALDLHYSMNDAHYTVNLVKISLNS